MKTKNLKYKKFIPIWKELERHYVGGLRWSVIERESDFQRQFLKMLSYDILSKKDFNWARYLDYEDFKENIPSYISILKDNK